MRINYETGINSDARGLCISSIAMLRNIPQPQWRDALVQLSSTNKSVLDGNLRHVENMLLNQAHALEAMFYSSIEKMCCSKYVNQAQVYSEMALKAQKQCRDTLIALAELKNPKQTAFIKQQNNAINQQVNNLEKIQDNKSNELLEVKPFDTMDTRTPLTAVSTNPSMETLAKIHRGENTGRKSH